MRRSIAIFGCLWLIPVGRLAAQPMVDRLPASTILYTGWSPDAALHDTKAGRMLADERVMQPWRAMLHEFLLSMPDGQAPEGERISEHFPKLLLDAATGEGCFALLDLKPERGGLSPQAVLILKLGERRADFEEHFKPINARLKQRLGERLRMVKAADSWLWMKSSRDRAEYTWGFVGDLFVVYLGDGADRFIAGLRGGQGHSLKDSAAFTECMRRLPGDSFLTTYIDVRRILGLTQLMMKASNEDSVQLLSNQWIKIASEFGLDNARSLGEKTTIEDEQFVTRSLLRTDGPPHGLLAAVVAPAVDDSALKAVPRDATYVLAGRFDLTKLYAQLKAAVVAIAGEDGKTAFGVLEDAAADAGVPVNNLLEPLGDQWVLYEASSTGGFVFTGMTLVVDIRSKEHLDRVIGALVQLIAGKGAGAPNNPGGVLHTYEVDGVTIQYLQFNRSFDLPALITPAWAATGKKLVVALYPQVIEDAVRQLKADQSILDNPSFVATLKRTGGGGPLLYLSGPELARTLYPLALPIFAVLRGIGLADPGEHAVPVAELLPSLQRLLQYVGSDGVSIKLTPDGILRTKSVANPLLSPLTLTDSIPLWVAIALPSINAAKVTTDRVRSSGNLHQIGQALTLYANENQGKLPRDFATMIKTQDLKSELFQSPFGDGKGTGDYKYLFVEGMTNATPADVVLAYDTAGLERDDGTNVLYGDGHVEWLDHDGVVAALDKSSQWREEQMKKGK